MERPQYGIPELSVNSHNSVEVPDNPENEAVPNVPQWKCASKLTLRKLPRMFWSSWSDLVSRTSMKILRAAHEKDDASLSSAVQELC